MRAMLFGLVVLVAAGCAESSKPVTPSKIENVTRVFFMGSGSYAVLTENPETKELNRHYLESGTVGEQFNLGGCPADKKMWVDVLPQPENNTKKLYVIHVRVVEDVGAGNVGGKNPTPINIVK